MSKTNIYQSRILKMNKKLFPFITLVAAVIAFACTDEVENLIERKGDPVYDTVRILPNARILEYTVENVQSVIHGAIDDSTNTITVYLPHYYRLGFIDPLITLPEGTTIAPEDDELIPVFSEEPFVYTVSAPDEEDVSYTVRTIVQQPKIILDELSSSEETREYEFPGSQSIIITGENFIPDLSITTSYLIDENENERPIGIGSGSQMSARSTSITYPIVDDSFAEGLYWVEMRAYALTARMKYPIYLKKRGGTSRRNKSSGLE